MQPRIGWLLLCWHLSLASAQQICLIGEGTRPNKAILFPTADPGLAASGPTFLQGLPRYTGLSSTDEEVQVVVDLSNASTTGEIGLGAGVRRFYLDITVWNSGTRPSQVFLQVNGKVPLEGSYQPRSLMGSRRRVWRVVGEEPNERIPPMPWGHIVVEPGKSVRFQELDFIKSGDTLRLVNGFGDGSQISVCIF